jgi:hypothetical protein
MVNRHNRRVDLDHGHAVKSAITMVKTDPFKPLILTMVKTVRPNRYLTMAKTDPFGTLILTMVKTVHFNCYLTMVKT